MHNSEEIPRIHVTPTSRHLAPTEHVAPDGTPRTVVIDDEDATPWDEDGAARYAGSLSTQYDIIKKIGDGGMGVVYLARDRKLDRYVAIKRLHREAMARASLKERFFREAKTVATLSHVHIVHVYALDEDQHGPYIVMEYVAGPPESSPQTHPPHPYTLADRVHREGPLTMAAAIDLLIKLIRAVEYAHNCGVIHRDLKPSNVLLNDSREPKIVDFGLARRTTLAEAHLTVPGERMLSLGYGAPEQESDASVTDERADIYGLGALLYFSITGKNPRYFREGDLPEPLRMPVIKALETDRDRRWGSAGEFLHALMLVKAPSSVELPTVRNTWRCKWCDTINPVAIQFCGQCGWDAGERCAECGANTRFGIQFCGECGADAREYEMACTLLARMRERWQERDYGFLLHNAERIAGFKPIGIHGQKLVEQIHGLRNQGREVLRRMDKLRERIPREIREKEYGQARAHIDEYRQLTGGDEFSEELKRLPVLTTYHELQNAGRAVKDGELEYATHICEHILQDVDPDNSEAAALLRRIRMRQRRNRLQLAGLTVLTLFFTYIYSAAPVFRLAGQPARGTVRSIYQPVAYLHANTVFDATLANNAVLWGVPNMFEKGKAVAAPAPVPPPPPPVSEQDIDSLAKMKDDQLRKIDGIETDYNNRIGEWPEKYGNALRDLQETVRRAGDYEGWMGVQMEIERFDMEQSLPLEALAETPSELFNLQERYRSELSRIEHDRNRRFYDSYTGYIRQLEGQQRKYTIQGKMDLAAMVNTEIKRGKASPRFAQAQRALAASGPP